LTQPLVPLIFEKGKKGRRSLRLPSLDVPEAPIPDFLAPLLRETPACLPEVHEGDLVRHFTRLSTLNHHIDKDFYPLGSCTMKYNPKINEVAARLEGLALLHPMQDASQTQGALALMWELGEYLKEIVGMESVTLQPAAGGQGELTGLLMIRAFHESNGKPRKRVLIPDSAHGTNPASVTLSGYEPVQIPSREDGMVDIDALARALDEDTAALMLTNPNTTGLFEQEITTITQMAHEAGAKLYMDGANLNALVGIAKPGEMGFDVIHINLHKTFGTPHGGGGPGAGPVCVKADLAPFLPRPVVEKSANGVFALNWDRPHSIGKVHTFWGNFAMLVRAYTYIRAHGADGLRTNSENAILNANYLFQKLKPFFHAPYKGPCQHEFVLSAVDKRAKGIKMLDIAKRLLDFGVYAPTIYFPLIVPECMMVEPTETETRETMDCFADILERICKEIETDPEKVKTAPHTTPVRRLDEAACARKPVLRFSPEEG